LAAISEAEEVIPAAPRSWRETRRPSSRSRRQHSMSIFSANGSPTWTFDLLDSDSSLNSSEAKVAPWMPSRPVLEPSRTTRFPSPVARERTRSSVRIRPTHIAFTSGLPE
jgi:hypothetical protein